MRAACIFAKGLAGQLAGTARVQADLYGSLALTGLGHATDRAILLGLSGNDPATIDPAAIELAVVSIRANRRIVLAGSHAIPFQESTDLVFHRDQMFPPGARREHPNGLRLTAFTASGEQLAGRTFFSIGGGFIVEDGVDGQATPSAERQIPYPFRSAAELLEIAREHALSIDRVMLANECARWRDQDPDANDDAIEASVRSGIENIWQAMQDCAGRGMASEGILPGGLQVSRRAYHLAGRLRQSENNGDPLAPLDWVSVFAMAVNEENAAGGRVVTAPTNGAAGVVPAVALYYRRFVPAASEQGIQRFFLSSAAIGALYKENASISGAEVGCQGEVGVACSMAAAGLASALGGNDGQIEHAAEVAMEHNLGMTCDPIGGLVQIPCIERNAMGAAKAILAARLAMNEPAAHKVSLDQVIRTMYLTGLDMQSRYKETSLAGLALNAIAC
jgi:L-serine dehydratase